MTEEKDKEYLTLENSAYLVDLIGRSLQTLGIPAGYDLVEAAQHIADSTKRLKEIGRAEVHREFERTMQASENMLNACLAGARLSKEKSDEES